MSLRRNGAAPLIFILVVAFGSLAGVLAAGWSPKLGLDLQGGLSVALQARPGPDGEAVTSEQRDLALEIIRSRVDALGVAEPEITGQGSDIIVVNLPDEDDPCRALDVIRTTAQLRFRPVLARGQYFDPNAPVPTTTPTSAPEATTTTSAPDATTTTAPEATTTSEGAAGLAEGEFAGVLPMVAQEPTTTTSTTAPAEVEAPEEDPCADGTVGTDSGEDLTGDATTTTAPEATTTTAPEATTTSEGAFGLAEGEFAGVLPMVAQDDTTTTGPTDTTGTTTPTTVDPNAPTTTATTTPLPALEQAVCFFESGDLAAVTDPDEDDPTQSVVLPDIDGRACYQLGPVPSAPAGQGTVSLLGSIVQDPQVSIQQGQWGVDLAIDPVALPLFNQTAFSCNPVSAACPTGQLAVTLDGQVQTAPVIQQSSFPEGTLRISGAFPEAEARQLALVLKFGALPLTLDVASIAPISPSLGRDSLDAGIIAGLIGSGLVVLYLLLYYRALGFVAVFGTIVWMCLNYAIIAALGETRDLSLSLSGITGIVISIGVTVDAYIVYFERLKDDVRSGRTIRSSVDKSFKRAFRTILAANLSSLIGAVLLYTLTIGQVRGFAFFLGLSTLLGLVVSYLFTRPVVALLARSPVFTHHRVLGIARGLGVTSKEAA